MVKRMGSRSPSMERSRKRPNVQVTDDATASHPINTNNVACAGHDDDVDMTDASVSMPLLMPAKWTEGPRMNADVQEKLQAASRRTPRFLFRVFRVSEDARSDDTPHSITPRLFCDFSMLPSIFELSRQQIGRAAYSHVCGTQKPCVFSAWTMSLQHALEKARELDFDSKATNNELYIAVIDTRRLPEKTLVLHTSCLSLIDRRVRKAKAIRHCFLAYGIIHGSAYSAVPYRNLLNARPSYTRASLDRLRDAAYELKLAKVFGQHFGAHFELPVTAMLLAFSVHDDDAGSGHKRFLFLLQELNRVYTVPAAWKHDRSIMTDDVCLAGDRNVKHAYTFLRWLTLKQLPCSVQDVDLGASFNSDDVAQQEQGLARDFLAIEYADEENDGDYMDDDHVSDWTGSDGTETDDGLLDNPGLRVHLRAIPEGVMDDRDKSQIQEAALRTPRYLFRGWGNSPRNPSGGYVGLNTPERITPLAFLNDNKPGRSSIYSMRRKELTTILYQHLFGAIGFRTRFSSWGASLLVAWNFAVGHADSYISITDTQKLAGRNAVLHVPSLSFLLPACERFDMEYLAYGIIDGDAHRAIPTSEFSGIMGWLPRWSLDDAVSACSTAGYDEITASEVRLAKSVAERFGPDFVVPVTVALLTLYQRCGDYWQCEHIHGLENVVSQLQDCNVPEHWCRDPSILADVVYTNGYGEVKQMIRLLRALVNHFHGKGARTRSRSPRDR